MRHLDLKFTTGNQSQYRATVAVDRSAMWTGTLDGATRRVPRDSGIDLFAPRTVVCPPRETTVIDLGVCISAYDVAPTTQRDARTPIATFLMARSSTGTKTPLRLANAVGLIDEGYRGPLRVAVDNISDAPFTVEAGSRYFQLTAADGRPFEKLAVVEALDDTVRGNSGFGSTGGGN